MAAKTRLRRRTRRTRPPVRRVPAAGMAARQVQPASGDLMIGGARDPAEKTADRTAERIMRMSAPAPGLRGAGMAAAEPTGEKPDDEEKTVRAKADAGPAASGSAAAPASPGAAQAIGAMGPGRALAPAERAFFEPRLGADLSPVRIHEGRNADRAAKAIDARAFALGSDIGFAAGEYAPGTDAGRRLMAHELAHAVAPSPAIRRDDEEAPPAPVPTTVTLNFTGAIPAGRTGPTPLRATTDVEAVTWSIENGSATKAAGTTIAANGRITVAADQAPGSLMVRATNADGAFAETTMNVSSVPTGVSTTAYSSDLSDASTHYGAAFQNTFVSSDGNAASLEGMRVGERFPGAPTPTAATHAFSGSAWPFGARDTFTLHTGTLAATAAGAWTLDGSGQFGPVPAGATLQQGDNLSTDKSLINVGNHIQSASNPQPVGPLPVTLTLDQDLHWYNPLAAAAARWTKFVTLAHSRTLRSDGSAVSFVTTLNGAEHVEDYEGKTAVFNLTASPVSLSRSAAPPTSGPAPAAKTVALTVQALPAALATGETLAWSIVGNAAGCTVAADSSDSTRATLTVGTTAATVTVEAADQSGTNRARVAIRIT